MESRTVTFHGPHHGHAGALVPLPEKIRKAAAELDGRTMPLAEGMKKLLTATEGRGKVEASSEHSCVFYWLECGKVKHIFRVIRYK